MVLHACHGHTGESSNAPSWSLPQVVVADAFGGVGVQESVFQHGHAVAVAPSTSPRVGGRSLPRCTAPHLEARVVLFAGGQPGQAHMVPVLPFAGKAQQFHRQGKAPGWDVEPAETGPRWRRTSLPASPDRISDHPGGGEVHEVVAHGGCCLPADCGRWVRRTGSPASEVMVTAGRRLPMRRTRWHGRTGARPPGAGSRFCGSMRQLRSM